MHGESPRAHVVLSGVLGLAVRDAFTELNMIRIAMEMANKMSDDPRTKVGCIIERDGEVLSAGVNQLPEGVVAHPKSAVLTIRSLKNKVMVHAEIMAILNSAVDVSGSTAYVTHHPCERCARALAAYGVKTVIVPNVPANEGWEESQSRAAMVMVNRGINLIKE